jgi:hypothetical protein
MAVLSSFFSIIYSRCGQEYDRRLVRPGICPKWQNNGGQAALYFFDFCQTVAVTNPAPIVTYDNQSFRVRRLVQPGK